MAEAWTSTHNKYKVCCKKNVIFEEIETILVLLDPSKGTSAV